MMLISRAEPQNSLQLLLLVFVKFGLTTPYDLKLHAGMSVGVTSPALKRLELAGLLGSLTGPRRSVRYAITEKGEDELRAALESGRTDCWGLRGYGTFESTPRAIVLAWVYFGMEDALRCVGLAAEELEDQGQRKEREAEEHHRSMLRLQGDLFKGGTDEFVTDKDILIATTYRWMKAKSDAALLKMQAEVIASMAPLLPDLPPSLQMPLGDRKAG